MINVVGAGEDPENLTSPTFYSFTPKQKSAPAPVKPVPEAIKPDRIATPVASGQHDQAAAPVLDSVDPVAAASTVTEPVPTPEPIPTEPTLPQKPSQKTKNIVLAGIIGLVILIGGFGAAVFLGQTNQDVRQQASTATDTTITQPTSRPTTQPTTAPKPKPSLFDEVETLALAPTLSPTPTPTPELISTTEYCGESCAVDENCQNPTHSCVSGSCRLSSNPTNLSCKTPSGSTKVQWDPTQPARVFTAYAEFSGETPQSGPTDWLKYGWIGISAIGIGVTIVLFL